MSNINDLIYIILEANKFEKMVAAGKVSQAGQDQYRNYQAATKAIDPNNVQSGRYLQAQGLRKLDTATKTQAAADANATRAALNNYSNSIDTGTNLAAPIPKLNPIQPETTISAKDALSAVTNPNQQATITDPTIANQIAQNRTNFQSKFQNTTPQGAFSTDNFLSQTWNNINSKNQGQSIIPTTPTKTTPAAFDTSVDNFMNNVGQQNPTTIQNYNPNAGWKGSNLTGTTQQVPSYANVPINDKVTNVLDQSGPKPFEYQPGAAERLAKGTLDGMEQGWHNGVNLGQQAIGKVGSTVGGALMWPALLAALLKKNPPGFFTLAPLLAGGALKFKSNDFIDRKKAEREQLNQQYAQGQQPQQSQVQATQPVTA